METHFQKTAMRLTEVWYAQTHVQVREKQLKQKYKKLKENYNLSGLKKPKRRFNFLTNTKMA